MVTVLSCVWLGGGWCRSSRRQLSCGELGYLAGPVIVVQAWLHVDSPAGVGGVNAAGTCFWT